MVYTIYVCPECGEQRERGLCWSRTHEGKGYECETIEVVAATEYESLREQYDDLWDVVDRSVRDLDGAVRGVIPKQALEELRVAISQE
jgi:hypothetical protein